jgi:hypothetical protein
MADCGIWIRDNWSSVVGAVGIIGSLLFTAANLREDSRNRLVTNLLAIEERHRDLWAEAEQAGLQRIFSDKVDVLSEPLSTKEYVYLRRVILRFETGWRIEKILNRGEMKLLARDAGEFLSRPLVHAVWEKTKEFRNRRFVRFVKQAMERRKIRSTGVFVD